MAHINFIFYSYTHSLLISQIILPTIYIIISYFMVALPSDASRFFKLWLVMVLHTLVAQSLAVLISAAAPSIQVAVFAGPMSNIPMLLFCGFFIVLDQIKPFLRWLQYFSYFRYSFESVVLAVFEDLEFNCGSGNELPGTPDCLVGFEVQYANGNQVIEAFGFGNSFGKFSSQIVVLAVFFVLFRFLSYVVLRRKGKRAY